jgi:hypothetical protein
MEYIMNKNKTSNIIKFKKEKERKNMNTANEFSIYGNITAEELENLNSTKMRTNGEDSNFLTCDLSDSVDEIMGDFHRIMLEKGR